MQHNVRKRKREYIKMHSRLNNGISTRREKKEAQRLKNQDQTIRNNFLDKEIDNPKWKTAHIAKDDELEKHLKEFEYKQVINHLWMVRLDKDIIKLTTKVIIMFTPLEDTSTYKNMMIQLDDLKQADTRAATH